MKLHPTRTAFAAVLIAAAVVTSGCGKGTNPTNPAQLDQQTADDVAVMAGADASMNGGVAAELSAGAQLFVPGPQAMPGSISSTAWDTTFTRDSLTISVSRTFYNALGQPLPGYDPTAVRLVATTRITGTMSGHRYRATIQRTGMLDIAGINALQDTLTFNGTGSDTTHAQFSGMMDSTRTVVLHKTGARALSQVKLLKDPNVNPWPLSGTATWTITVDKLVTGGGGTIEKHFTATVVVTFDGTSTPDITINGSFHYRVNLLTGIVTRV